MDLSQNLLVDPPLNDIISTANNIYGSRKFYTDQGRYFARQNNRHCTVPPTSVDVAALVSLHIVAISRQTNNPSRPGRPIRPHGFSRMFAS